MRLGIWSQEEHDRFLEGIRLYPRGPWRAISKHVGSRSVRQVQTHAQKYHEKIVRRMQSMHKDRKTWARIEHRIDQELLETFRLSKGLGVPMSILQSAPLRSDSMCDDSERCADSMEEWNIDGEAQGMSALCLEKSPCIAACDSGGLSDLEADPPSFSESLDFLIEYFSD